MKFSENAHIFLKSLLNEVGVHVKRLLFPFFKKFKLYLICRTYSRTSKSEFVFNCKNASKVLGGPIL